MKEYNVRKKKSKIERLHQVYRRFYSIYKTMLSYCLKCRKNTESKNPIVERSKNERITLLSKCAVCDSKKSKIIKQEEAGGILSNLRIKTHLSKISLEDPLLF